MRRASRESREVGRRASRAREGRGSEQGAGSPPPAGLFSFSTDFLPSTCMACHPCMPPPASGPSAYLTPRSSSSAAMRGDESMVHAYTRVVARMLLFAFPFTSCRIPA